MRTVHFIICCCDLFERCLSFAACDLFVCFPSFRLEEKQPHGRLDPLSGSCRKLCSCPSKTDRFGLVLHSTHKIRRRPCMIASRAVVSRRAEHRSGDGYQLERPPPQREMSTRRRDRSVAWNGNNTVPNTTGSLRFSTPQQRWHWTQFL